MDCARLWKPGLGPACEEEQPEPDEGTRTNRQMCLSLLLCLLCGEAPAVILTKLDNEEEKDEEKQPPVMDLVTPGKGLIKDQRALAYLCDPERPVPFRSELLYSLL